MRSITTTVLVLLGFFFTINNSYAHDMGNCAQVDSALERLDCYDGQAKFLSSQGIEDREVAAQTSPAPISKSNAVRDQTEGAAPASKKSSFLSKPIESPIEYSATIAKVVKGKGSTKALVELSNGQIWQIQKSRLVTFKVGNDVVVKQGLIGGYMLRVAGGGSYRVKQIK